MSKLTIIRKMIAKRPTINLRRLGDIPDKKLVELIGCNRHQWAGHVKDGKCYKFHRFVAFTPVNIIAGNKTKGERQMAKKLRRSMKIMSDYWDELI